MEKRYAEERLGVEISDDLFRISVKLAKRKLQSLIQRFGDSNGVRRTPEYLAELVVEVIKSELLTEYTQPLSHIGENGVPFG